MGKLSEQAWGAERLQTGTNPTRGQNPSKQAEGLWGRAVALSLGLVVRGTGTDLGPNKEKTLRNATTYKLFPRTLLFEAPRCRISSGSEYSSPTMVGPASCKVSHSSCLTGCQVEVEGLTFLLCQLALSQIQVKAGLGGEGH